MKLFSAYSQGEGMAAFTEEELTIAKSVDLNSIAERLGYTVCRIGKYYTLKEMDLIRIYNRTHWFRWSRQYDKGENGGSQIDFLRVFAGMEIKEAVFWLLDFARYRGNENVCRKAVAVNYVKKAEVKQKRAFILPEPAVNNNYLYSYLNEKRAISITVIDYFIKSGLRGFFPLTRA